MSGSLSQGGRGQKPRLWNRLRKLFAAAVATTSGFYNISKRLIIAIDNRLTLAVDQQLSCHDTKPSSHTLTYTLLTFLIFLLLASLAVRFPTDKVRNFFISISSMLIGGVVFLVTRDFWRDFCRYCGLGKHTGHIPKKYRKNLGNTVFTILFMVTLITVVYLRDWYHRLNSVVLQLQENTLEAPRFPAVAILQDVMSSSQPDLLDFKPPKCFSGGFDENAPLCETLSNEEYNTSPSCNYKNSIKSDLSGNFTSATGRFRYFILTPPMNLLSKIPGYHLQMQAWFNFNATKAREAMSIKPSPDLLIAVFDPTLGLGEALSSRFSPLNLINANGITSINLNLNLRRSINATSLYTYAPVVQTSPRLELICDISESYIDPCFVSLLIHYPSHDRTIISEKRAMTWPAAAASAGGWLAFVQLLSWIISLQIFQERADAREMLKAMKRLAFTN